MEPKGQNQLKTISLNFIGETIWTCANILPNGNNGNKCGYKWIPTTSVDSVCPKCKERRGGDTQYPPPPIKVE